jgi:tRNA (guanosine-2'-O-)-methyltransferase
VPTEARKKKVKEVLSHRQPDLRVVLEEVTNTHNASAVVRTCDASGILYIDVISSEKKPFPVNEAISTRAEKWLQFSHHESTTECLNQLKLDGFKIVATHLGKDSVPYTEIDYNQPLACVFGNESGGISQEALSFADHIIKIPMRGMSQSLNLSVSVGIILYEALKQRAERGYLGKKRLPEKEFRFFTGKWLKGK